MDDARGSGRTPGPDPSLAPRAATGRRGGRRAFLAVRGGPLFQSSVGPVRLKGRSRSDLETQGPPVDVLGLAGTRRRASAREPWNWRRRPPVSVPRRPPFPISRARQPLTAAVPGYPSVLPSGAGGATGYPFPTDTGSKGGTAIDVRGDRRPPSGNPPSPETSPQTSRRETVGGRASGVGPGVDDLRPKRVNLSST